jgi:hypothetical protein
MNMNELQRQALAAREANDCANGSMFTPAVAQGTINGHTVRCEVRWTRRNPPSGIISDTLQTLWYIDGKRASAAKVQGL